MTMQNHGNVKTCCFIGHRITDITDELKRKIRGYIENLILNENVKAFLFGGNSKFDYLCQSIVKLLKEKYPFIKRVGYTCQSESVILESERKKWEKILSEIHKQKVNLFCVDEKYEYKTKLVSCNASYVEINKGLIDNSDYCLFYYNENYVPPQRKYVKHSAIYYQAKSGTAAAYKYATRKKKVIINFFKG